MKRSNVLTAAWLAAAVFAAYVSYDLASDAAAIYHFDTLETAGGGIVLWAALTGALWTTLAQINEALRQERQYSWPVNVARVLGFVTGVGAGSVWMAGALDAMPHWQATCALLAAFVGMSIFGVLTMFAPQRALTTASA